MHPGARFVTSEDVEKLEQMQAREVALDAPQSQQEIEVSASDVPGDPTRTELHEGPEPEFGSSVESSIADQEEALRVGVCVPPPPRKKIR